MSFKFAIDRGGTFTDIFAVLPNSTFKTYKLLSENPLQYNDAPFEGIRRIINEYIVKAPDKNLYGDSTIINIEWIRIGTTLATNALLERKGAKMALLITEGFKDIIYIGNQARPDLFDLNIRMPEVLYDVVSEVEERILLDQNDSNYPTTSTVKSVQNKHCEKFLIMKPLNEAKLKLCLDEISAQKTESIALVLMHSYCYPEHEKQAVDFVKNYYKDRNLQPPHISMSNQVMPMINIVPRGQTTCVDAYLTPIIKNYVASFVTNIETLCCENHGGNNLESCPKPLPKIYFMQSDGGLVDKHEFIGSKAILSGPSGGVIGYSLTTFNNRVELGETDSKMAVIGFDMGGTSTDVSRFDGMHEHVYNATIAGITMQCPQLDIETVAAGGGSILQFRKGLFVVGPESSGSNPGPTCYRKNGPLSITDANLCLGRLLPEYFPRVFGPNFDQSLDVNATMNGFKKLAQNINDYHVENGDENWTPMSVAEIAYGFISVANETMARAINNVTQARGFESSKHILSCFGSASGQHACAIARLLGIRKVFIHKYSGILSAYGMALADISHEEQESLLLPFESKNYPIICSMLDALEKVCRKKLNVHLNNSDINDANDEPYNNTNVSNKRIKVVRFLQMSYAGTHCPIMCEEKISLDTTVNLDKNDSDYWINQFKIIFLEKYKREFGFILEDKPIIVENVRVRAILKSDHDYLVENEKMSLKSPCESKPIKIVKSFFKRHPKDNHIAEMQTNVYIQEELPPKTLIKGPSIIISPNGTIIVEPYCTSTITVRGNVVIEICEPEEIEPCMTNGHSASMENKRMDKIDPIKLSLYCHRYMSIAERMGRMLKLTALSTNIKERLDFSCAIFSPDGGLVANAPHIPVHLGSMQQAVQYQIETLGTNLLDGDVILSNHPCAGGSHLPDLTVIKPVFRNGKPLFWVAARGHHADIGGSLPGSMPANSSKLSEEGATFMSFKIVENNVFKEKEVIEEFMKPQLIPGCSGARRLRDNIADLKAQIAACQKGIQLVNDLIAEYGLDEILQYMNFIRQNARDSVSQLLKSFKSHENVNQNGVLPLHACEYMDDGTAINLNITIDTLKGEAVFDFTGTGYQVIGNCNTPKAITFSAILYCLRCMMGHDIPLNQGCLDPIKIVIPPGSILDPSPDSAVVGGNVQTSQRIVDTIFKAFNVCAASQGCMNNITFGDGKDCVYYETIAGGSGAGPGFNGRSVVHTHMTNTLITDPEILERRYPVILGKFGICQNTGGKGQYVGGNGAIREMIFRKPLNLSILTERRVLHPYGLFGGEFGSRGVNLLKKCDGKIVYLGSKCSTKVDAGEVLSIQTPGGGGYGPYQ